VSLLQIFAAIYLTVLTALSFAHVPLTVEFQTLLDCCTRDLNHDLNQSISMIGCRKNALASFQVSLEVIIEKFDSSSV
jgi:hypothetical protein